MTDPDRDWKPKNRPQSTIAREFMTELDHLFRMNGDIDTLDKTVHQKKQEVSNHTQQLEALEARLRETEERLKQAKSSPPAKRASQPQPRDNEGEQGTGSPTTARRVPREQMQSTEGAAAEYVVVARPRPEETEDPREA
ncbi:hypothetical protein M011DRAFT_446335 [Sporormia fimetaria CBS 119925]|uniref:Uncharacterized protein n=1 Tax=Sporormia fimetaria CBS 119925 TaxID=1340428 RepID=A0A6A6V9E8_9PLEO|nr:hypothetical protein M011DRAFT_446335 [Sporormia fimetaria CBS 119925]